MKIVMKYYDDWQEFMVDGKVIISNHYVNVEDALNALGLDVEVQYGEDDE